MKVSFGIAARVAGLAFILAVPACRTPGASTVKDDAPSGSGLYCLFNSPVPSGEAYEIWATPTDGSQLTNVSERYSYDSGGASGILSSVGNAPSVQIATITQNGSVKFRAYFKDIVNVSSNAYSCYSVDPGDTPSHAGYLCLGNVDSSGSAAAVWATRTSSLKFATDYTLYKTTCGLPQSGSSGAPDSSSTSDGSDI